MLRETAPDICTHRDTSKILVGADGSRAGSNPNVRLCRNEQISAFGPLNITACQMMSPN